MNVSIRKAVMSDNIKLRSLQDQIAKLHFAGRPDLFKSTARYYTDEDFKAKLENSDQYIFAAIDETEKIVGYAFAVIIRYRDHPTYRDFDMFYIDDICVDEGCRRQGIGKMLYEKCREQAVLSKCHNIDLGVFQFNEDAIAFYESCGMKERMCRMEEVL